MSRPMNEAANALKSGRLFDAEAKLLDEGREDIRAGRCISGEAADAWLEGLDGEQELPGFTLPDDALEGLNRNRADRSR